MTSKDITGQRFGLWTALYRDGHMNGPHVAYFCVCDCGTNRRVTASRLTSGRTENCGCMRRKRLGDRARRHGLHTHRLYPTWVAMRDRCRRKTHDAYPRYGGRGITVCERWQDFGAFLSDMEPTWTEGLTLDRIDNDGHYCPENCRWATKEAQSSNRANTRILSFNGKSLPLTEWAKELGITQNALRQRMRKGWEQDRIFTGPQPKGFTQARRSAKQ